MTTAFMLQVNMHVRASNMHVTCTRFRIGYMQVYIVACLYSLSKKFVLVPVASAMTSIHRDRLVLASNAQWPEIQSLASRGQIISTDLP